MENDDEANEPMSAGSDTAQILSLDAHCSSQITLGLDV